MLELFVVQEYIFGTRDLKKLRSEFTGMRRLVAKPGRVALSEGGSRIPAMLRGPFGILVTLDP